MSSKPQKVPTLGQQPKYNSKTDFSLGETEVLAYQASMAGFNSTVLQSPELKGAVGEKELIDIDQINPALKGLDSKRAESVSKIEVQSHINEPELISPTKKASTGSIPVYQYSNNQTFNIKLDVAGKTQQQDDFSFDQIRQSAETHVINTFDYSKKASTNIDEFNSYPAFLNQKSTVVGGPAQTQGKFLEPKLVDEKDGNRIVYSMASNRRATTNLNVTPQEQEIINNYETIKLECETSLASLYKKDGEFDPIEHIG